MSKIIIGAIIKLCGSFEIENGTIYNSHIKYSIRTGNDLLLSSQCDSSWGSANLEYLKYIKDNVPDDQILNYVSSLQPQDNHWNWLNKTKYYSDDCYDFFYFVAENDIQAMCVTYQPKKSTLYEDKKIFYIEYIAVAPWNRDTLLQKRKYSKIATTLIAAITYYLSNNRGLFPSFSLHSLPQAAGYYEKLGMVNFPKEDKDSLKFYEIPKEHSLALLKEFCYA